MNKKKLAHFKCPACGDVLPWVDIPSHIQDHNDDAHLALENELQQKCDDAYTDAEFEWIEENCERVEIRRKKKGPQKKRA